MNRFHRFTAIPVLAFYLAGVALTPARAAAAPLPGEFGATAQSLDGLLDPASLLPNPTPGLPDPLATVLAKVQAAKPGALSIGPRTLGAFGYGWQMSGDNQLKMYAGFDITELRGDGGRSAFTFHPANPNAYLWSYDGDSYICYYDLDQGSYAPASGMNTSQLQRLSATEYVVTDQDQTKRYWNRPIPSAAPPA